MPTVTISMPDSLKQYVDEQVRTQGFGNVSEYFRSLVRDAQKRESMERLDRLILEGLESEAIPATPEFWRALKIEAAQRLTEAKRRSKSA